MEATSRISQLNDEFRRALLDPKRGSRGLYLTAAIARRPLQEQSEIIKRVVEFDDFTAENDPYGEHDFGSFEFAGERYGRSIAMISICIMALPTPRILP